MVATLLLLGLPSFPVSDSYSRSLAFLQGIVEDGCSCTRTLAAPSPGDSKLKLDGCEEDSFWVLCVLASKLTSLRFSIQPGWVPLVALLAVLTTSCFSQDRCKSSL